MDKSYIIGITGGSASGKTLFLDHLMNSFEEGEICLLSQDNYYKKIDAQPIDENGVENFDAPESIDRVHFLKDIKTLKSGKAIEKEEYTFNNPDAKPKVLKFMPAPILIIEGIFVFHYPEIADLLDLKIFIDAKESIKLKRRIVRDNQERGYDLDDVLYRYEKHVSPTYDMYIEPYKYTSDIVIPNNEHFKKGLEVIVGFLKTKIA
ncbi:uridine kinase [Fulvivirgaceae bacterium BMA10]|uniref:uridine/cytidine kinase n=1 Tax=Splendidivirga corallicola TaxID=3051826 RepID=A0ABT8KM37_9BACT|nr:uridine kinase [Fulvivirgaceae bacterium BMA10]